ncbi:hypothetical protein NECAME_18631, partial [Necator americanus]
FAGKTAFEEALVDSVADQFADYLTEVKPYFLVVFGITKTDNLEKLKKDVLLPGRAKLLRFVTNFLKKSKS